MFKPYSFITKFRLLVVTVCILGFQISQAEDDHAGHNAASNSGEFVAGTDYAVLDTPVRTADASKIEVVEVFWYGCSHCYHFEASLQPWAQTLADDVLFVKSPAMWNAPMKVHAGMFFTAKQLNLLDKMHTGIFTAMHVEKKQFITEPEIEKFFGEYGVDAETFNKTFRSFSVDSLIKQADAKARSYQITGTPEMVVNGKYRISARLAGSQPRMLEVADYLIAKEREMLAESADAMAPPASEATAE